MIRKRRGISEMVAVVLVLIIVSVAGALLYRVSLETMGTQYTTLTNQVSDQTLAAEERFEIVAIEKATEPTDGVKVYVLNYTPDKTIDIIIDKIYINGVIQTDTTIPTRGLVIQAHEVKSVTIWGSFNPGQEYNILVISQRGIGNASPWEWT
jgi:hypothetical protein